MHKNNISRKTYLTILENYCWFSILPSELIEIILLYYTNTFRGLIKFSSVCKQWKEVVDYSLLWLMIDLQFYASRQYMLVLRVFHDVNDYYQSDTADFTEVIFLDETQRYYPSMKFKFEVNTGMIFNDINNNKSQVSTRKECFHVRTTFMKIFVKYKKLWSWYVSWKRCLRPFLEYKELSKLLPCMGLMILVFSMWFFVKYIELHESYFLQLGFLCFYVNCLFCIFSLLMELVNILDRELTSPEDDEEGVYFFSFNLDRSIPFRPFSLTVALIFFSLGIYFSVLLFHLKLSTVHAPVQLNYSDLAIPLWFGSSLAILSIHRYVFFQAHLIPSDIFLEELLPKVMGVYTLFAVPLTCSFVGLYYDQLSQSTTEEPSKQPPADLILIPSLKFALYPILPSEFGLFLMTIISCIKMLRSRCTRAGYAPISSVDFKYHLSLFQLFLNMSIAAIGLHYWIVTDPNKIGSIILLTMFFYGFVQFYLFHYLVGDDDPMLLD